jgi:capsular polysaccharide export protein
MKEWHDTLRGKRVLLLQGPVGPFFRHLARRLRAAGAEVHKVNFNGGDCLFYPRGAVNWRGCPKQWPEFLQSLLVERRIDLLLLFGDCRPIHRVACQIAQKRGVRVGAFEEGYIRPNFITFEHSGVNGYSRLPRAAAFYRQLPPPRGRDAEREVGHSFRYAALWAALYYVASAAARRWFRYYRHHRSLTLSEGWPWVRSAWRKLLYRFRERGILERLTGALRGNFFLVPLQVSVDSQVRHHSDFRSVQHFIRHVIASFAAHATGDALLVIKHHPLGRGHHDYRRLIAAVADEFGVAERVSYVHDLHLPALLGSTRGVVVINSTAGLTALEHGAPVKVCGVAVYDIPGLTYQGSLDEFWRQAESSGPDAELLRRFRAHLVAHTQINGSFYAGSIGATAAAAALSVARALNEPRLQQHSAEQPQTAILLRVRSAAA